MRKPISLAVTSVLLFFVISSCVKDTVKRTYSYTLYRPVYKTVAAVHADLKSAAPQAIQQPGKLYVKGSYIYLNEVAKGIHVIDNSNPAQPKNVAFIPIPGNVDMAVKGNTLYADLYTDLVALDITNPTAAHATTILNKVFPDRNYYNSTSDSTVMVVDWIRTDTTMTDIYDLDFWQKTVQGGVVYLNEFGGQRALMNSFTAPAPVAASAAAPSGMGGSMARFTVVADRLYTVDYSNLHIFNIATASQPQLISTNPVGFAIETLFPFLDKLFIGSSDGMFIYDILNADAPVQLSRFSHVKSCDPVIADAGYAYVTLRTGTFCNGSVNELNVLDIKNLQQPALLKTYNLTSPHGLSKDGNLLFVCDGTDGLNVYDATKPEAFTVIQKIRGLETYDVIAYNNRALVVAKDGLYQYDYTNPRAIKQLSKLTIAH